MKRKWVIGAVCAGVVLAIGVVVVVTELRGRISSARPGWAGLTVSKETTLITGPLRADGTVDYVAMMNEKFGVAAEDNAFVALAPAIGTDTLLGDDNERLRAVLGVERVKPLGVAWDAGWKPTEKQWARYREFMQKPWKAEEGLEFDGWLDKNEGTFAVAREAAKRPRFWVPVTSEDGTLAAADVGNFDILLRRVIVDGLCMRAMRSAGAGDVRSAWEDLWAAHRLASLVSQDTDLIGPFLSFMLEEKIMQAEQALLGCPQMDRALAAEMLANFKTLPEPPGMSEIIHRRQIWKYPATIQFLAARMKEIWDKASGSAKENRLVTNVADAVGLFLPDWDRMARTGNEFYAKYYAEPPVDSEEAFEKWRRDEDAQMEGAFEASKRDMRPGDEDLGSGGTKEQFLWPRSGETRESYTDRLGRNLIRITVPQIDGFPRERMNAGKRLELMRLACAVELFRLETGAYPKTADEAAQRYGLKKPMGFWNKPLDYRVVEKGFELQAGDKMKMGVTRQ